MSPQILILTSARAAQITFVTHAQHPWFAQLPMLARRAAELLRALCETRGAELHAWCVLPDRVELVVRDGAPAELVRAFKARLDAPARVLERARRLWPRTCELVTLRENADAIAAAAREVFEAPAELGLLDAAGAYPWRGLLRGRRCRERPGLDDQRGAPVVPG